MRSRIAYRALLAAAKEVVEARKPGLSSAELDRALNALATAVQEVEAPAPAVAS